jgi:HK97 family phage prohead protease
MPSTEILIRSATLERGAADTSKRTVPASLSSEAPVRRFGESEVLRHDAQSIDLGRAVDGLPLLFSHDRNQPIGRVENIRLDGRRLVGELRFGQSAKASEVWQDIVDGVLRDISIGYLVDESEASSDGYVATRWTPFEASVLAIPADTTVGIGRSAALNLNHEEESMPELVTRASLDEVRLITRRHCLGDDFASDLVRRGLSLDAVRSRVLDELAKRDLASGGHLNVDPRETGQHGNGVDERSLIIDALASRLSNISSRPGNPYQFTRVTDMARAVLEQRGIRTTHLSQSELIERSCTTSDFPSLLQGAGARALRQAYGVVPGIKRAFKPSTSPDFRAKYRLMLSETPALQKVNEHGEFRHGAMAESRATYSLETFGRIVSLTRQALINDDLGAFGDMINRLGRASAEFESQQLVNLLTANPSMDDGVALFHANHGNTATGAGSALQLTSLAAARTSMRLQKGLDGKTPIDATPSFLIVPAALETTAEQLITTITAAKAGDVNPFGGRLDLIVDPRLDVVSSTAWYLAADPALVDTIEYSYLEGVNGPEVLIEDSFSHDATSFKIRLDFGAGVLDFRGLYRSAGA